MYMPAQDTFVLVGGPLIPGAVYRILEGLQNKFTLTVVRQLGSQSRGIELSIDHVQVY